MTVHYFTTLNIQVRTKYNKKLYKYFLLYKSIVMENIIKALVEENAL